MRKIICILLSSVLMACVLSVNIFANTDTHCDCVNHISDNHNNGNWTSISGTSGLPSESGHYYLENDIDLDGSCWTIEKGEDIHLCLNGKTIRTKTPNSGYMIDVKGTLTITDCSTSGKIIDDKTYKMFNVSESGTLNIYSGNIIHNQYKGNIVTSLNGVVNIYGGTMSNPDYKYDGGETYGFLVSKGTSKINVFGGDFTVTSSSGTNPYIFNTDGSGEINISGGNFDADYYGYSKYSFDAKTTITGGTFKIINKDGKTVKTTLSDIEVSNSGHNIDLESKIGNSYSLVSIGENKYQVKYGIFEVGGEGYLTIDEAYNSTSEPVSIKLLKNTKLDGAFNVSKEATLDLNGYTIQGTNYTSGIIRINKNGKLTIKDSSDSKSGKLYAHNSSPSLIRVIGGELIVDGGNYTVQVDNYVSYNNLIDCKQGKVILNDGNFSVLAGVDTKGDNLFSSVVAATKIDSSEVSEVTINGGTYNAYCSKSTSGKFASRIFTPYNSGSGYGTINVKGGNFNGDYNTPDLTNTKEYVKITGGSFDREVFEINNKKLRDMIDTNRYYVKESSGRYDVTERPASKHKGYTIVNTCVE